MLKRLMNWGRGRAGNVCFCTLAIHAPYRQRARLLVGDATGVPWVVLTDELGDFEGLPVQAIRHTPTGPMAVDFLTKLPPTGTGRPAYHDKRFVLQAALREFETAIFVDADTRFRSLPEVPRLPPGIAVTRAVQANIAEHLTRWERSADRLSNNWLYISRVRLTRLSRHDGAVKRCLRYRKTGMSRGSSRPGRARLSSWKARKFFREREESSGLQLCVQAGL